MSSYTPNEAPIASPAPKKNNFVRNVIILFVVGIFACICCWGVGGAVVLSVAGVAFGDLFGLASVSEEFMQAVQQQDYAKVRQLASSNLQREMGNGNAGVEAYLKGLGLDGITGRALTNVSAERTNNLSDSRLTYTITTSDGATKNVTLSMQKVGDAFRVDSISAGGLSSR